MGKGEPLLYPQIDKLLEYLCEKKFQKSILTNAILLNDKLIDIIKSHHFKFGISLDGATEKTHEFLRGKHTFERTINNILKLKKNNIHFSITSTIYKENKDTIEDIADLVFNKLGGTILNFNLLMSLGRGQSNFELSVLRNEIEELNEKVKKIALKYPHNEIVINDQNELLEKEYKTDVIYCTGGTEYLAINNFLEVYPCTYGFGMQEFKMGIFGEESIMDIWKNEKWHLFRGGVRLQDLKECSDCMLKFRCTNKSCRLKPVYQGNDFYSACRPCNHLSM